MITMKINAKDAGDLGRQVLGLCKLICGTDAANRAATQQAVQEIKEQYQPKHEDITTEVQPVDPDYQPKHAAKPEVKSEDVQKALAGMLKLKGKDAVRELLKQYGAEKFPELEPEHYQAVLEAAKRATR